MPLYAITTDIFFYNNHAEMMLEYLLCRFILSQ